MGRVQSIQASNTSLEDEQTSDMYSLGVVLWEILARRVRLGIWGAWMRTVQGRGQGPRGGKGGGRCRAGFGLTPWRDFHLFAFVLSQIPWDGYTNEDIEKHVRNGERVPELVRTLSSGTSSRTARVWVSIRR